MSFCLDCGFVVRLPVLVNQSVPVLLSPSCSVLSSYTFFRVHWLCHAVAFVRQFLRQSGIRCSRDRAHPGIYHYVRPRRAGASIY